MSAVRPRLEGGRQAGREASANSHVSSAEGTLVNAAEEASARCQARAGPGRFSTSPLRPSLGERRAARSWVLGGGLFLRHRAGQSAGNPGRLRGSEGRRGNSREP